MHSLITAELNNLNTMSQCIFIHNYLKIQSHFLSKRRLSRVTVLVKKEKKKEIRYKIYLNEKL